MKYSKLKNHETVLINNEEVLVSNCLFVSKETTEDFKKDGEYQDGSIYYQAIFNNKFGFVHFEASEPTFIKLEDCEFNGYIENEDEFELSHFWEINVPGTFNNFHSINEDWIEVELK